MDLRSDSKNFRRARAVFDLKPLAWLLPSTRMPNRVATRVCIPNLPHLQCIFTMELVLSYLSQQFSNSSACTISYDRARCYLLSVLTRSSRADILLDVYIRHVSSSGLVLRYDKTDWPMLTRYSQISCLLTGAGISTYAYNSRFPMLNHALAKMAVHVLETRFSSYLGIMVVLSP